MSEIESCVYIFGAHSRARTLYIYLKKIKPSLQVKAFLIDNDENNPKEIEGLPVVHILDVDTKWIDNTIPVYIGTRGVSHKTIIENLRKIGFSEFIPVSPSFDMELRNEFLKLYFEEKGKKFEKLVDYSTSGEVALSDTKIYVIKSASDSPLDNSDKYKPKSYEYDLQVGANLTDKHISDITDNTGENISERNRQFCELTGLYWMWKNSDADIIGLEHYRRHFILPDDWMSIFTSNSIDAILPVPLFVSPSLAENYRSRHMAEDLQFVYEYLEMKDSLEAVAFKKFMENDGIYSPCNMFIMKKEVLNDMCEWMFPVLFALADKNGIREDTYQNRYPGFISERLISFFFDFHRDKYKMVYADKDFRG